MRTISSAQRQAIEDLSAEGLLRGLPVQTAEKDIHITDLLKALSELRVMHGHFNDLDARKGELVRHDAGIRLVFAGGTCLAKAHGLIQRMSEDIDLKVVLEPTPVPLKKGRGQRARLTALHQHLTALLAQLQFPLLPPSADDGNPSVRDAHRYFVVGAGYRSTYSQLPSLRPELKLEVIHRTPLLALETRQFGYLHESLAGLHPSTTVTMPCISVAETAAEKVLSLLRRCAVQWTQPSAAHDPTLVRHVHDVARIAEHAGASLAGAREVFPHLVRMDQAEFKGQNPAFDADPVGVLQRTLAKAKHNSPLRQQYLQHLLPLVYDSHPPSFEQAFAAFESVAQDCLAGC